MTPFTLITFSVTSGWLLQNASFGGNVFALNKLTTWIEAIVGTDAWISGQIRIFIITRIWILFLNLKLHCHFSFFYPSSYLLILTNLSIEEDKKQYIAIETYILQRKDYEPLIVFC